MAVTSTFNYNLPNYGFGDMIGMGMFGNQFGCNVNPYVNMGVSIFGFLSQAAVSYINGSISNKNNNQNFQQPQSTINNIESKASKYLSDIGSDGESIADFDTNTSVTTLFAAGGALYSYTKDVNDAQTSFNSAEEALDSAKFEKPTKEPDPNDFKDNNDGYLQAMKEYRAKLEAYNKAEADYNTAKTALENAKTAEKSARANAETAIKELKKIKAEYDNAINEAEVSKQEQTANQDNDAQECVQALNKLDGSAVTRAIDGKNSSEDKLNELKNVMKKFSGKSSKITASDLQLLNSISDVNSYCSSIKDETDDTKSAIKKVIEWKDNNKNLIAAMSNVINNNGSIDQNTFNTLESKGYAKTIDTKVGGTKKTAYKVLGQYFYQDGNSYKKIIND